MKKLPWYRYPVIDGRLLIILYGVFMFTWLTCTHLDGHDIQPGEEVLFLYYKTDAQPQGLFSPHFHSEQELFDFIDFVKDKPDMDFFRNTEGQITGVHKGKWGQYVLTETEVPGTGYTFTPLDDPHILIFYTKDGVAQPPTFFKEEVDAAAFRKQIDEDPALELSQPFPFIGTRGTVTEDTITEIIISYDITP